MQPIDFARLSKSAYSDQPTIGHPNSAAQAVVYGDTVAFVGTENVAGWLADMDVSTLHTMSMGRIHAGFKRTYNLIRADLIKLSPKHVTGHSLGAALALLYSADLCLLGRAPAAIYAFEPPRISCDGVIGNLLSAHDVDVFLYKNGLDIVPDIPRILNNWQHPADLIHIGQPSFPFANVSDHMIDSVIESLMHKM